MLYSSGGPNLLKHFDEWESVTLIVLLSNPELITVQDGLALEEEQHRFYLRFEDLLVNRKKK